MGTPVLINNFEMRRSELISDVSKLFELRDSDFQDPFDPTQSRLAHLLGSLRNSIQEIPSKRIACKIRPGKSFRVFDKLRDKVQVKHCFEEAGQATKSLVRIDLFKVSLRQADTI